LGSSPKDNKPTPLFAVFAEGLIRSISRLGDDDEVGKKLREVEDALPMIELQSDPILALHLGRADVQAVTGF
jgi:hypothetical protein